MAKTYPLPAGSGVVENTALKRPPGSLEGVDEYRGGSLLGWNISSKGAAKITFYDNPTKAEGANYGPIIFTGKETKTYQFNFPPSFQEAIFLKVNEGEVEGVIWADVQ